MLTATKIRPCLALALSLGLVSCSDEVREPSSPRAVDGVAPLYLAAATLLQNAREGASDESGDALLLKIEAAAPGFAGFYWDEGQAGYILQMAKGGDAAAARSALRSNAAKGQSDFGDGRDLGRAVDRPVNYSFSQLVAAKQFLARTVFVRGGAVALDADERANRVRIDMAPGSDRATMEAAIRASGVPREMVSIATEAPMRSAASVRDRSRPGTVAGLQIDASGIGRCTMGYNVTTSLGETGFLTAGHCVSNPYGSGATGQTMYQPVVEASNIFGTSLLNTAWNLTSPPSCVGFSLCTMADVAFVQYSSTSFLDKKVARTNSAGTNYAGGSITIKGYWTASGSVPPTYVGQSVDKLGRTTGWTRGSVDATCMDVAINLGLPNPYVVICADRVTNSGIGQGDSGGPVWVTTGNGSPLQPLGILFGGGPMNQVDWTDGGTAYCTVNCKYFFSNWNQLSVHLNRYFNPAP